MSEPRVVMKFGGSSVADPARLRRVAERIRDKVASGYRVCVVVSAMGDTTDELLERARAVSDDPPRRELDMLLSCGERASMALLAMSLDALGVPSISFTGSQSGILTNDVHSDARILEVRPYRVHDELDRGRVVIVAGFQGVSYRREITTLGRGGSDTTAVALAAALDAEACEIYSDVDGVFTADPAVVPAARRLAALSFEEMQELATSGARVLNAQAVQFAKERGIALYARKTDGDSDGTVVRRDVARAPGAVRGVAHKDRFVSLVAREVSQLGALMAHLQAFTLSPRQVFAQARSGEAGGVFVLLPPDDAHGLDRCLSALPSGVHRAEDVGAISLVGEGVLDGGHAVVAGLGQLGEMAVDVLGVSTSSFRVTFLVDPQDVHSATKKLHEIFVEQQGKNPLGTDPFV